jgi:hypothetical protein
MKGKDATEKAVPESNLRLETDSALFEGSCKALHVFFPPLSVSRRHSSSHLEEKAPTIVKL